MKHFVEKLEIETKENSVVMDITDLINEIVDKSGISNGHIVIKPLHTTVGIYINEGEERLLHDFMIFLNRIVPNIPGFYLHDDISKRECPPDEPVNGHSHLKSALFSNSTVSLILSNNEIIMGRYQRVLFAEFDGPCPRKHKTKREIAISIIGE